MKLTYWVAKCEQDSDVYSIRAKTRKEAIRILTDERDCHMSDTGYWFDSAESAKEDGNYSVAYQPIKKTTVEYADSFDLLWKCSHEDARYWEHQS